MKTIKIIKLNIEVEAELRPKVLKKDLIIPKGWRLLTFSEFAYIAENELLPLIEDEQLQWGTIRDKISALGEGRSFGGRLFVDSDSFDDYEDCRGIRVRFCRDTKKKEKTNDKTD